MSYTANLLHLQNKLLYCEIRDQDKEVGNMQKIVIFTSSGGGGHLSASNALTSYLKDQYEIVQIKLLDEVLSSFDPIALASLGKKHGEAMYNALTPYNQWWLLNLIYRFGRIYFGPLAPFMRSRITQCLKEQNADLVISVIPIFNKIILKAAQDLDIPFLLLPTDLDIRSFVYNIRYPYYKKFHLSLIYDDNAIKKPAKFAGINEHNISVNGFPLRSEFFQEKDRAALRTSMGIELEKPVIMIMMGSQGANNIISCVKSLSALKTPAHLLICIGKHTAIKDSLLNIRVPEWVTIDIIEETNRISDYMATSDLLISKSGTASFCEAIHMRLPMIIDGSSSSLVWERFNHRFTKKHNLGSVITNYNQLPDKVSQFFSSQLIAEQIKHNQAQLNNCRTPERIRARIARMFRKSYEFNNFILAYGKKTRF